MAKKSSLFAAIREALADTTRSIDELRGQIAALQHERERIAGAPLDADSIRKRVFGLLESEGQAFAHRLRFGLGAARVPNSRPYEIQSLTVGCRNERDPDAGITTQRADLTGLLVWLVGDVVRERLEPVIAQLGDGGINNTERVERLAELDSKLLGFERQEEALIVEAETAGMRIVRRPDADPRVVLEVA